MSDDRADIQRKTATALVSNVAHWIQVTRWLADGVEAEQASWKQHVSSRMEQERDLREEFASIAASHLARPHLIAVALRQVDRHIKLLLQMGELEELLEDYWHPFIPLAKTFHEEFRGERLNDLRDAMEHVADHIAGKHRDSKAHLSERYREGEQTQITVGQWSITTEPTVGPGTLSRGTELLTISLFGEHYRVDKAIRLIREMEPILTPWSVPRPSDD